VYSVLLSTLSSSASLPMLRWIHHSMTRVSPSTHHRSWTPTWIVNQRASPSAASCKKNIRGFQSKNLLYRARRVLKCTASDAVTIIFPFYLFPFIEDDNWRFVFCDPAVFRTEVEKKDRSISFVKIFFSNWYHFSSKHLKLVTLKLVILVPDSHCE